MRKADWPCLSTETLCAETRNSFPTAQLQGWELQGPGLTSGPWDSPRRGSRSLLGYGSAAVRELQRRRTALLRAGTGPAPLCYGEWEEPGRRKQEPKLCCSCVRIYASLGGSFSPFISETVSVVLGLLL